MIFRSSRDALWFLLAAEMAMFEPPAKTGPIGSLPSMTLAPLAPGRKRVYTLAADGRTLTPDELTPGASDGTNTEITPTTLLADKNVIVDTDDEAP